MHTMPGVLPDAIPILVMESQIMLVGDIHYQFSQYMILLRPYMVKNDNEYHLSGFITGLHD